jgi:aryl-alcohol dehydrogenase-like predicted oxidoreductase
MPGTDPNAAGNQRKNMMQAVEASLKRLKTDYIDLYGVYIGDQITPVEEAMRGLNDLVRPGQGRHWRDPQRQVAGNVDQDLIMKVPKV